MVYSVKRKEREGERRKGDEEKRPQPPPPKSSNSKAYIKKLLKNTVFNIQPDFGEAG